MFCPTTTPFDIKDIAPVLSKPLKEIETAWKILQPHFGAQLNFGCHRVVVAPNFFDVIAMSVLIEILKTPQTVEKLTITSMEIAEDVAIFLDQSEFENPFDQQQRTLVLSHLISLFNKGAFQNGVQLSFNEFWAVAASILDVFKKIQLTLESSASPEFHSKKGALPQIPQTA